MRRHPSNDADGTTSSIPCRRLWSSPRMLFFTTFSWARPPRALPRPAPRAPCPPPRCPPRRPPRRPQRPASRPPLVCLPLTLGGTCAGVACCPPSLRQLRGGLGGERGPEGSGAPGYALRRGGRWEPPPPPSIPLAHMLTGTSSRRWFCEGGVAAQRPPGRPRPCAACTRPRGARSNRRAPAARRRTPGWPPPRTLRPGP